MIGCVLLAGGKSSRMNGIDKALVSINNKTLIQLILDKLKIDNNKIVLNTNRDANNFKDYNLNIINDTIPNFQGPLAGILSGLEWFDKQDNNIEWVVSLPIDTPFFPENLVDKLFESVNKNNRVVGVANSNGRNHPVFAIWHISLKNDLKNSLKNNIRKIDIFTQKYTPVEVHFTSSFDQFFNVNTPDDLKLAEDMFSKGIK